MASAGFAGGAMAGHRSQFVAWSSSGFPTGNPPRSERVSRSVPAFLDAEPPMPAWKARPGIPRFLLFRPHSSPRQKLLELLSLFELLKKMIHFQTDSLFLEEARERHRPLRDQIPLPAVHRVAVDEVSRFTQNCLLKGDIGEPAFGRKLGLV